MTESKKGLSIEFLAAVGTLTLNWAAVETALDYIVTVVFHRYSRPEAEPEIPRSLDKKLTFLKDAIKADPRLDNMAPQLQALITRVHNLKERRHEIVHGPSLGPGEGDATTLIRVTYGRTRHTLGERKVTTAGITTIANAVHQLADDLVRFVAMLMGIPEDDINKALSE